MEFSGTPLFAPPQFSSRKDRDDSEKTDEFSCGRMLFWLVLETDAFINILLFPVRKPTLSKLITNSDNFGPYFRLALQLCNPNQSERITISEAMEEINRWSEIHFLSNEILKSQFGLDVKNFDGDRFFPDQMKNLCENTDKKNQPLLSGSWKCLQRSFIQGMTHVRDGQIRKDFDEYGCWIQSMAELTVHNIEKLNNCKYDPVTRREEIKRVMEEIFVQLIPININDETDENVKMVYPEFMMLKVSHNL